MSEEKKNLPLELNRKLLSPINYQLYEQSIAKAIYIFLLLIPCGSIMSNGVAKRLQGFDHSMHFRESYNRGMESMGDNNVFDDKWLNGYNRRTIV